MVKYIECSARKKKNLHNVFDEAIKIAMGPISWAEQGGHTYSVKLNINEKDSDGQTLIHRKAEERDEDLVTFLLSEGADPYISGYQTVRDILASCWSENWEEDILSSYSSKSNYKAYIAAALARNKEDFLKKFLEDVSQKKRNTLYWFLTRDAVDISNLLAFMRSKNYHEIDTMIGGEGENRFYLVKTKVLRGKAGDRSLLQYIVDNRARMMKQREELLDLLAEKIEKEESKIVNNLKLGLPSSTGLAECIKMTEEKFPWSKMKAGGMITFSLTVNLLSFALYCLDVYTDGQFVDEMFNNSQTNFPNLQANCTNDFYDKIDEVYHLCKDKTENFEECLEFFGNMTHRGQKCKESGPRFDDLNKYTECFWYSLIHCIAPIVWTFLVFVLTMKVSNIWRIPFPPITRIVKFYQHTLFFQIRTKPDFKEKVPEIEAKITDHEDLVNLSSSIGAATESSPQFFFQTVYILPNLILNLVRFRGLEELVSYKMLSIAFSFTSVAVSNYFIRFYTNLIVTFQTIVYQES